MTSGRDTSCRAYNCGITDAHDALGAAYLETVPRRWPWTAPCGRDGTLNPDFLPSLNSGSGKVRIGRYGWV